MSTCIDAPRTIEQHTRASLDPLRPLHVLVRGVHELHKLEHAGESGWTPVIAILGLVLFLGVAFLLMAALAETAYYVIA